MRYTVGEMAKILGIAPSTLRYYNQEGLLPLVTRSRGGMRLFTDADYETLIVIDCLKKSGLSIREIKSFIALAAEGDSTLKERLALFEKRRESVKERIQELQETLELLNFKCWYYETATEAGTEEAVRHLSVQETPAQYQEAKARLAITDQMIKERLDSPETA